MPTLDMAAYAGGVVFVLLAACFGLLALMRDPAHKAPHTVRRWVRCPQHDRSVLVEFTERVQTSMAYRSVRRCPIRGEGERCGEGCAWEPLALP
jgi:hypothetical protein